MEVKEGWWVFPQFEIFPYKDTKSYKFNTNNPILSDEQMVVSILDENEYMIESLNALDFHCNYDLGEVTIYKSKYKNKKNYKYLVCYKTKRYAKLLECKAEDYPLQTNCKNCGAVLHNCICEYCGADYRGTVHH